MIYEKKLIEEIRNMVLPLTIAEIDDGTTLAYNEALVDVLNAIEEQPRAGEWIPVEEKLPDKDGEYLVYYVEDEERCAFSDKEGCEVIRFDADLKAFGFWVDIFDYQISAYSDRNFDEFYGVVAWMPLPEPYVKGEIKNDQV